MSFTLRTLAWLLLAWLISPSLPAGTALAADIPAFVYHRFEEPRYPSTNISRATFAAQLAYLQPAAIPVHSLGIASPAPCS